MELQEVYQAIINGRAILLTGSGAHMSAVRMDEKPFPLLSLSVPTIPLGMTG